MVKDHSDSERGNPLPPHRLLFPISSKGSFICIIPQTGRKEEVFYLTMHSTHFIYSYMASDIWSRTILIVREETHCHHIGYSFRLAARVLLYAPFHRQDSTYHGLCCTSCGALAGWEGRKEMFYLTTHSTLYLWLYGVRHKNHSDRERGNPLLPHRLLFPISSKGSFICIIQQTG